MSELNPMAYLDRVNEDDVIAARNTAAYLGDEEGLERALEFTEFYISEFEKDWGLVGRDYKTQPVLSTSCELRIALSKTLGVGDNHIKPEIIESGLANLYSDASIICSRLGDEYKTRMEEYMEKAVLTGSFNASMYIGNATIEFNKPDADLNRVKELLGKASKYVMTFDEADMLGTMWVAVFDREKKWDVCASLCHILVRLSVLQPFNAEGVFNYLNRENYCKKAGIKVDDLDSHDINYHYDLVKDNGADVRLDPSVLGCALDMVRRYEDEYIPYCIEAYETALMYDDPSLLDVHEYDTKLGKIFEMVPDMWFADDDVIVISDIDFSLRLPKEMLSEFKTYKNIGLLCEPKTIKPSSGFKSLALVDINKHEVIHLIEDCPEYDFEYSDVDAATFRYVDKRRYVNQGVVMPEHNISKEDILIEQLRRENDYYLELFKHDLEAAGLKPRTIKNHLDNIEFYLDNYVLYYRGERLVDCLDVNGFLGDYYVRKCMWASPTNTKSFIASFKKFFRCLSNHEEIPWEDCAIILEEIRINKQDWIDASK